MIHVNKLIADEIKTKPVKCPTCKSQQQFLMEHYPWYGWDITCLNCGESWQDGTPRPRPFIRGWRKKRIQAAKTRLVNWQVQQPRPNKSLNATDEAGIKS